MALKITAIKTDSRTAQITISGKLDSETSAAFDQQIQKSIMAGARIVILDMAKLEMITSAGVGVVMKTQTTLVNRAGELMMLNMQPQIKKVFEIVRLLPTLTVFESTEEMDNYLIKIQQRMQEEGSFDSTQ
ncbi:MAG: STAS domain-containing protein [Planctomycetota bacterium]|jgi:anti-anti-sigma factor